MAMRNPYAAYKQQARISENKLVLKNLQEKETPQEMEIVEQETSKIEAQKPMAKQPAQDAKSNNAQSTPSVSVAKDVKVIQKENPYLYNAIMTASSEDLVLLLYGGAIKFMKQAISYMNEGKIAESNHVNQRAQAIFEELMCTLDVEGQPVMSKQLYDLYEFINFSLIDANIKKDPELIQKMIEFTTDLRATWQEAAKSVKKKTTLN